MMRASCMTVLCAAGLACTPAPREATALVDISGPWTEVSAEDDPFAGRRPDEVSCGPLGWYLEVNVLEVNTEDCNYLAISQPMLSDIRAGEWVSMLYWHAALFYEAPAVGWVGVALDGVPVAEFEVGIPAKPASYEPNWEALDDVPEGAPLSLHLTNHGSNTWNVARVERLPTEP